MLNFRKGNLGENLLAYPDIKFYRRVLIIEIFSLITTITLITSNIYNYYTMMPFIFTF